MNALSLPMYIASKSHFNTAIALHRPTLVLFYTTHNDASTAFILEMCDLAKHMKEFVFCLLDIKTVPAVAGEYGVVEERLPTFLFFNESRKVGELVGPSVGLGDLDEAMDRFFGESWERET